MEFHDEGRAGVHSRDEVDRLKGPVLLEFGAAWCGHCQALAPQVKAMMKGFPEVRHIQVEDGPGQHLGRSFRVKLWPTFIFLHDGREVGKAVRPHAGEVREGLEAVTGKSSGVADQPESP